PLHSPSSASTLTAAARPTALPLHAALPLYAGMAALTALVTVAGSLAAAGERSIRQELEAIGIDRVELRSGSFYSTRPPARSSTRDRKSTRLNSSHVKISYAVFCWKKKKRNC